MKMSVDVFQLSYVKNTKQNEDKQIFCKKNIYIYILPCAFTLKDFSPTCILMKLFVLVFSIFHANEKTEAYFFGRSNLQDQASYSRHVFPN